MTDSTNKPSVLDELADPSLDSPPVGSGTKKPPSTLDDFAGAPQPSLAAELFDFLKHNKKWWLTPILLMLGLFGILMALAATGAAPFIYTMF